MHNLCVYILAYISISHSLTLLFFHPLPQENKNNQLNSCMQQTVDLILFYRRRETFSRGFLFFAVEALSQEKELRNLRREKDDSNKWNIFLNLVEMHAKTSFT